LLKVFFVLALCKTKLPAFSSHLFPIFPEAGRTIPSQVATRYALPVTLSVVIITYNEEANLARTLHSVMPLVADGKGEIIVVDSGSTDRTVEIARSFGARVFVEEWKGYAAQKNSAIDKATGDWILSLDADEEVDNTCPDGLPNVPFAEFLEIADAGRGKKPYPADLNGFRFRRRNYFLGRWIKRGGFWPDRKIRLFRRGYGRVGSRAVHETLQVQGRIWSTNTEIIHHSYPTLSDYIEHMNRYSSLGAEMAVARGNGAFSVVNVVLRPLATFIYNYFFRLGFLDGREGLLLHLYHGVYVSWKYAKAWELGRKRSRPGSVA
jgi:glycosyltransferase involved in cell wall biosynthesis